MKLTSTRKRILTMANKLFISAILATLATANVFADKVGLLIMATGKYIKFVEPLVNSARDNFCKNHEVTYFVFTDGQVPPGNDIVSIYQPKLGWPFDTMMRFETYARSSEVLSTQDYLFACDADMRFVNTVGDEILGERVATTHPCFLHSRGCYDRNPQSLACVWSNEGGTYFAGAFYGGKSEEVLKIAHILSERINDDLSRGIIAEWHDESHWNRYCLDHKPTVILSPSYCYPESWNLPYTRRLLALDKNHQEYRSD